MHNRMGLNKLEILQGDAIEQLRTLPDQSVQCCVTSPPYWGLRDYGTCSCGSGRFDLGQGEGTGGNLNYRKSQEFKSDCLRCHGTGRIIGTQNQLGLEATPEAYVAAMVGVFSEVKRVLHNSGTLWLNLGDSYASDSKGTGGPSEKQLRNAGSRYSPVKISHSLKPKDMCMIPERLVLALQADGWWVRSKIVWAKKSCMPESVTDRPTNSWEPIFLLTKQATYFYDAEAVKEKAECNHPSGNGFDGRQGTAEYQVKSGGEGTKESWQPGGTRNQRNVWHLGPEQFSEAHFATFPSEIPRRAILAGTSARGCCPKCLEPWVRVVEKGNPTGVNGKQDNSAVTLRNDALKHSGRIGEVASRTIGWQWGCECKFVHEKEAMPIPCTVLDPFAGSGTTGMVALELGRKAVLIELNPEYVKLIRQWCDVTPGLQLA